MPEPTSEIRFYHARHSRFLLEIGPTYARTVCLKDGRALFTENPSIVRMWDRWAHEGMRIDVIEHDRLELSANPEKK